LLHGASPLYCMLAVHDGQGGLLFESVGTAISRRTGEVDSRNNRSVHARPIPTFYAETSDFTDGRGAAVSSKNPFFPKTASGFVARHARSDGACAGKVVVS